MFNIGDKVKFLNESGGGVITQLVDKDTVMVLSDIDDFEIPVFIGELINVSKKETVSESKNEKSPILKELNHDKLENLPLESSILLVVEKEDFSVYLSNAMPQSFVFGFYEQYKSNVVGVLSSIIEPQSIKKLTAYNFKSVDEIVSWRLQGFYFSKEQDELSLPVSYELKCHPSKIFKENSGVFIAPLQKKAIVYPISNNKNIDSYEKSFDGMPKDKEKIFSSGRKKKQSSIDSNILEVDLHINELLETTRGMSSKEMLEYQLDIFNKTMEDNKKNKGRKIIFIHGIGNGVLKQRLRHLLKKYPRYIVQDASFQQYGWGATMVIIK